MAALAVTVAANNGGAVSQKVPIPAGTAIVGADHEALKTQLQGSKAKLEWFADETPQKKVEVEAFNIDATEVTNDQYKKVFPKHEFPANLAGHPVVNVTWDMADEYCRKVGGRLPAEAEFERAARGDDGRVYPWGDEFDPGKAIYVESGGGSSKLKVGSFELEFSGSNLLGGTSRAGSIESGKSPFGVYDMAGNVWEWQAGWYDEKKKLRLLKGGSWLTPKESLRSAARLGDSGDLKFNDYGFRCAYTSK